MTENIETPEEYILQNKVKEGPLNCSEKEWEDPELDDIRIVKVGNGWELNGKYVSKEQMDEMKFLISHMDPEVVKAINQN